MLSKSIATGKKLSATPILEDMTASPEKVLQKGRQRIQRLQKVKLHDGSIKFGATIQMVSGKQLIADNKKSFEDMALTYKKWLVTKKQD